jgi:hypothetical protein
MFMAGERDSATTTWEQLRTRGNRQSVGSRTWLLASRGRSLASSRDGEALATGTGRLMTTMQHSDDGDRQCTAIGRQSFVEIGWRGTGNPPKGRRCRQQTSITSLANEDRLRRATQE